LSGTPSRPSADAIYQGAMWPTSIALRESNAVVIELPSLAPIRRTLETSRDGVQHDFTSVWALVGDNSAQYLMLSVVFHQPNEQLSLLFDPSVDRQALAELGKGPMAAIAPAPDADVSDLMHGSGFLSVQLHLSPGLLAYVYGGARWHAQRDWLGWTTRVTYVDGPTVALRFEGRAYPTEQVAEAAAAAASQAVPTPAVALASGPVVIAKARIDQIERVWEGTATTAGVPFDLPYDVVETNIAHDLSLLSRDLDIRHDPALLSQTRRAP
jgi:hypothetical protein